MELRVNSEISKWREEKLVDKEFYEDIRDKGLLQPLIARRLPDGKLELIAGHRRFLALKALGKKPEDMDIKILENVSDVDAILIALSENRFRKDLNPIEEARAFKSLRKLGLKPKQIAEKVRRSESVVKARLALLKLPEKIQQMILAGEIEQSYAIPLLKLKEFPEAQLRLAKEIASASYYSGIHSVEEAEKFIKEVIAEKKHIEQLIAKYGPCPKCGSKNIEESPFYEKEKLCCNKCGYEWHRETKDPWKLYELKQEAEKLGLKIDFEAPGKAKLTPKEVAEIIEERKKAIAKAERPNPRFRCFPSLEEILAALIADENVLSLTVNGDLIQLKLVQDTDLHFTATQKDFRTGEKCVVHVHQGWGEDESLEVRLPRVKQFIESLAKEVKRK